MKADSITILGLKDAAVASGNVTRLPSCNIDRLTVPCVPKMLRETEVERTARIWTSYCLYFLC
jgi:hypothetical protein